MFAQTLKLADRKIIFKAWILYKINGCHVSDDLRFYLEFEKARANNGRLTDMVDTADGANRGVLLQVKTNFRTAITVPEKSWARFRDIFADYCEKMKEAGASGISSSTAGGGNILSEGKGSVVAQVPSPSTSTQPNPNPNLDSPLIK